MAKYKYIALIRDADPAEDGVKYLCEIVGWTDASGHGGNTPEEAIEDAKQTLRHFASRGKFHQPNIKAIEFEIDL